MTLNATYSQFLFDNRVPRNQANAIGNKISSKIRTRQPLTQSEIALTSAYLNRPGANKAAERHVGLAILTSNNRSAVGQSPAIRTPAHTPEWTNHQSGDPGTTSARKPTQTVGAVKSIAAGAANSRVEVRGWNRVQKKPVVGKETESNVRALVERISLGF